jgi:hypothetical protein
MPDRSSLWFKLATLAGVLAGFCITGFGLTRETSPDAARWWLYGFLILGAATIGLGVAGAVAYLRGPRIKYRTHVDRKDESAEISLWRTDLQTIAKARCRIAKRKGDERTAWETPSGKRPSLTYPDDFEALKRNGPLSVGRWYHAVWEVREPDKRTAKPEWRRVGSKRFAVTQELHDAAERLCERGIYTSAHDGFGAGVVLRLWRQQAAIHRVACHVRQHLPDGTLGEPFVAVADGEGEAPDARVAFPNDFKRETGQTFHTSDSNITTVETHYDYPDAAPGTYDAEWFEVLMSTSGDLVLSPVSQDRFVVAKLAEA